MARKTTYRKRTHKKRKHVSRRYKRYTRRIPRSVSVLANVPQMQKMRYCEGISLSPAVNGDTAVYQFRANSIYDPNYTAAGHQPMRHDQWALFYSDYTVLGSKITVKHVGSGANNVPTYFGIYLDDNGAPPVSYNDLIEQGRGKSTIINSQNWTKSTTLTYKFSARKFFGVKNVIDNHDLGALTSDNPTDIAMFNVIIQAIDKASATTAQFLVTIDYIVHFSQAIDQPSS